LQYSSTNNLITAAYDIGGAGQASLNSFYYRETMRK
jgi:hypothetical protein